MSIQFRHPRRTARSSLKRAGPIAAALVAGLMFVPTASSGTYPDKSGDNGSAGDITGITVVGDKTSGQLVFRISGTNLSPAATIPTFLLVDSDANPLTGDTESVGADYMFGVDDDSYGFAHWNGSDWVDTSYDTVRITGGPAGVMISVNRSELGNATRFNFWARSYDRTNQKWDDAPDDGAFNYSIDANGPDIQGLELQTAPGSGPKAGSLFRVTPTGLRLPSGGALDALPKPESYSCAATLGARVVRGTGTGRCTFALPKRKSRGKRLSVMVTVNYQGVSKAFTYAFKVR
jgi:hypothetical protein